MPPGAPDSISYLPTTLMNHWALIKLTMPLSSPAADGLRTVCCTAPEDRQSCKVCAWILIAFFIDYSSPIYKKNIVSSCRLNFSKLLQQENKHPPCQFCLCLLTSGFSVNLLTPSVQTHHFRPTFNNHTATNPSQNRKRYLFLPPTVAPLDQNAMRLQGN